MGSWAGPAQETRSYVLGPYQSLTGKVTRSKAVFAEVAPGPLYLGMNMDDIKQAAICYWHDRLAKFWPTLKGPSTVEIEMYRAGYEHAMKENAVGYVENCVKHGQYQGFHCDECIEELRTENAELREELWKTETTDDDQIVQLELENARLREALKSIACGDQEGASSTRFWLDKTHDECAQVCANDTRVAIEALYGKK